MLLLLGGESHLSYLLLCLLSR